MLKIGDFSRIAHVSIKTLRHYAYEGLLEPVYIDRFSGYRYYSLEQLPLLNRVLALKDLGFSLEQIKQLLTGGLSADELRGMLRLKKVELKLHLQEEQLRLTRVEKRLEQIEIEGLTTGHEVLLKPIQSCMAAWAKTRAATIEQAEAAREGLRELIHVWCTTNRIHINGPWFSLLEDNSYSETNVDLHLGVFVEDGSRFKDRTSSSPVRLNRLSEIPMAACLLGGLVGQVPQAELMNWIEINGYHPCGETRLVYLGETPESPLTGRVIEIQTPVSYGRETNEGLLENKEIKMEPIKFETLPSFKVMGMKYRGKNENNEISAMWSKLNPRAHEIPMLSQCAFGVCFMISDARMDAFEYVAGFKVAADAVAPEGMVVVDVPENRYAVFEHRGSMESLRNTYNSIINEWFPRSGLHPIGGYDMEIYDEKFKDFAPDSVFYIYEPVK